MQYIRIAPEICTDGVSVLIKLNNETGLLHW